MKIAIVQALWNRDITDILTNSCEEELKKHNVEVVKYQVAGAVEIPVMAQNIIIRDETVEAVIAIGVVLKGGTDHYEHVANQVSYGCQKVALSTSVPVIFGILTVENKELALSRANGSHSFSGVEWANAAVSMVSNIHSLIDQVESQEFVDENEN